MYVLHKCYGFSFKIMAAKSCYRGLDLSGTFCWDSNIPMKVASIFCYSDAISFEATNTSNDPHCMFSLCNGIMVFVHIYMGQCPAISPFWLVFQVFKFFLLCTEFIISHTFQCKRYFSFACPGVSLLDTVSFILDG